MSFESQVSTTETSFTESTTIKSASLELASLRTLEEIKAAFSDLSKEEVCHKFVKLRVSLLNHSIAMIDPRYST